MKHERIVPAKGLGALGLEDRFAGPLLAVFAFGVAVYLALGQRLFQDGDLAWHIRTGFYIIHNRAVPTADPFSYTFAGHAWLAHEWLAEVVMAAAFKARAWAGISLLYAAAASATIYLIGRELLQRLPARWALCLLFVICGLLHPHWLARPHLLTWPILAIWTLALRNARDRNGLPPPLLLPLMVIWANIHASYILGLVIAAAFAAEAWLRSFQLLVSTQEPQATAGGEHRKALGWFAFVLAAALLGFVTPHGLSGFTYPFEVSGLHLVTVLNEWRPTNLHDDRLFIICAALLWLLIAFRWRAIHPARIGLLAVMMLMALNHARHQMPFVVVAVLIAAPLIRQDKIERKPIGPLWVVPAAVILCLAQWGTGFRLKDNWAFPLSAIAQVPPDIRAQHVFNSYAFGGPLILAGVRPYIDGRTDMYGDEFTLDYVAALRGNAERFEALDGRWRFGWAILAPNDQLTLILDSSPQWRCLYADRSALVYARRLDS